MKTKAQELQQVIESADSAINREDFDGLTDELLTTLYQISALSIQ